ncbi:phage tail protein [Pseudomonas sp. PDM20]|uniref:phage tail protein n=1 Tax=Pseudomonas sp. PDM20 TaxID=2769254 RepID=UPI0017877A07|nr:phage tail protein [Pseudomonas sp. PDM20]MBD9685260.1 phage tail protein [Pseudomonas sp. PDM20]
MSVQLPNGSTLSIASIYAVAKPVTALSNAANAVASVAGHGLSAGAVVEITSGWAGVSGRVARVTDADTATLTLGNVNTVDTSRFVPGSSAGSVRSVTTWMPIQQVVTPTASGGEQQFATYQFLEDDDQRQIPTFRNAQTLSIEVADDPSLAQWAVIEAADLDRKPRAIRLSLRNGSEIYYNGYVTVSDTPKLSVNEIMTRTVTIALLGRATRYNA